jgi:hypothetical protein
MSRSLLLAIAAAGLTAAGGCGPIQATMAMPNPATTHDRVQARQVYEVGPYKENHRYEAAFDGWTKGSVRFSIRLVHPDACADPANWTFTLSDDAGRSYAFAPASQPARTTAKGRAGAVLRDVTVTGDFPAAVTAQTQWVELRMVPRDPFCKEARFRWDLTR